MPMCANGYTKLSEELGELSVELARLSIGRLQQVVGKRLAYFHTDDHPDGAGPLSKRIEAEMGDVLASMQFVCAANGLDWDNVARRAITKTQLFQKWHAQPDNNEHGVDRPPATPKAER